MNVLTTAQTNMDVSGVNQAPVIAKASDATKTESNKVAESSKIVALPKKAESSELEKENALELVETLKDLTHTLQTKLNFSVDEGTDNVVVKVIDKDNGNVIRQIPQEEFLEIQEKMQDLTGFLVSNFA